MNTTNYDVPSNSTSRRKFLKGSVKMAASALVAGIVPRMYAAEDNTIRLALVGCGGRGTGAVTDAFATTGGPVKLFAAADLFEPRIQNSLKLLGEAHADKVDVPPERRFVGFDAYRKAIDCLRPGDVVLLTTHAAFRPMHFEYAVNKGINVFAEFKGTDRRFQPEVEVTLFRIAQGAIGNILEHSEAKNSWIKLECDNKKCALTIQDDGRGFDVSKLTGVEHSGRGSGLFTMRERTSMLGGSGYIESRPGHGTKIIATVPQTRTVEDLTKDSEDAEDTGTHR